VAADQKLLRRAAMQVDPLGRRGAGDRREIRVRRFPGAARVGESVAQAQAQDVLLGMARRPQGERELIETRGAVEGESLGGVVRRRHRVLGGGLGLPGLLEMDSQSLRVGAGRGQQRGRQSLVVQPEGLHGQGSDHGAANAVVVDLDLLARGSAPRPHQVRGPQRRQRGIAFVIEPRHLKDLKVAVVGGTGGIGRALSRFMASRGAHVTIVGQTFRDQDVPGIEFIKADLNLMGEAKRVGEALQFAVV
jgi:hypothetical protein